MDIKEPSLQIVYRSDAKPRPEIRKFRKNHSRNKNLPHISDSFTALLSLRHTIQEIDCCVTKPNNGCGGDCEENCAHHELVQNNERVIEQGHVGYIRRNIMNSTE